MPADQSRIEALVAQYQGLTPPQRHAYNEANTRKDFIEPLFEALGWNVRNKEEVDAEKLVRPGFADYAFLQHGVVRFYLEAKPLEDDIYEEQYARQVITYAYSKGTAWAVLTNFARLVVFDALEQLDGGAPRRVLDLECGDYVSSLNLLTLLTPESLADGSLTAHAERIGVRRRAIPIEKRLYESMRTWREELFNDMATALGWRTDQQLREGDEAIQRLLDRLIFLRNCEDRGIGEPGLRALRNRLRSRGGNVRVAESLLRLFDHAASTYDSELFQTSALIDVFMRGSGTIIDGTLAEVIEGLYSVPKSFAAYDFGLIDADVLGQVYEQYLGHVAQRVRQLAARPTLPGMPAPEIAVKAKRERRKERGIYYTPKWVVHYIVRHTVGRFLEEHANDPEAIANLTILDPASGSGSFLIRAYETLLEHHARQMGGDVGHLDRKMREWVLRHNIFGVDLDPQALEIARLSLLIRMVREEEELPPLADNIQLGNSLISGGEDELRPYFGDTWPDKRPFDWQREFPDIMARGGFDIVIGNPPYVRIQTLDRDEVRFYNDKYDAATGNYDIYCLFVDRGLQLLKPGGRLGFIIPNKFLHADYGKGLRHLLSQEQAVERVVDFGDAQVFDTGTNYTCLILLRRAHGVATTYVPAGPEVTRNPNLPDLSTAEARGVTVSSAAVTSGPWVFVPSAHHHLMGRMDDTSQPLSACTEAIFQGIVTSADAIYILEFRGQSPHHTSVVYSRHKRREYELEPDMLHPVLKGSLHMRRYALLDSGLVILFPYTEIDKAYQLIPESEIEANLPLTHQYLRDNFTDLAGREEGKMQHSGWYGYVYPKNLYRFARPKLLTPSIAHMASFSADPAGAYYFIGSGGGGGGGYGVSLKSELPCSLFYVLGLLNSQPVDWYLHQISSRFRGGYRAYNRQYIGRLPIHVPDLASARGKARHDRLDGLGHRMLDLHQRLAAKGAVRDDERAAIQRETGRTDREIDALVYDLYGLTTAERDLVEREMAR